jgi:hypothetical protein
MPAGTGNAGCEESGAVSAGQAVAGRVNADVEPDGDAVPEAEAPGALDPPHPARPKASVAPVMNSFVKRGGSFEFIINFVALIFNWK